MNKHFILLYSIVCSLNTLHIQAQQATPKDSISSPPPSSFSLVYMVSGLGSGMGSMQPTLSIQGKRFVYTYEQNSYYGEKTLSPDTILVGELRSGSIDSIITLLKELPDTSIEKTNHCVMSGAIEFMTIHSAQKSVSFKLWNTMDARVYAILCLLNQYLPADRQLWAEPKLINSEDECWKYLLSTLPALQKQQQKKKKATLKKK